MGHRPVKRGARLVEIDARRTFGSCGKDGAGGVTGERISGENSRVRIVFDRTGERGSAILIHFVCGGLVPRERLGKMFIILGSIEYVFRRDDASRQERERKMAQQGKKETI